MTTKMNSDNDKQPDELEQQLQQQPTLPLVYLPIELAEETSLYFGGREAAKLLRVSRSFHSLFLPRAWIFLYDFIGIKGDEARQHLLEKYGHFVRCISLTYYMPSQFKLDWLLSVKHATHLGISNYINTTVEMTEMLMMLIKQSKALRTLDLHIDDYEVHTKFNELTAAINGLECLECITCKFSTAFSRWNEEYVWERVTIFVDLLHPSKRSKLMLKMNFEATVNEVDVRALAPYISELKMYGHRTCAMPLVDAFCGVKCEDGQPLVFPQLEELEMSSCCFNSECSGIMSITASQYPQLQRLCFSVFPCHFERFGTPNRSEHETYNWKPEYSGYAHIIVSSQRWQYLTDLTIDIVSSSILMDIIDFNPQLQQLVIGSMFSSVLTENDASKYNHDEFQLDTILYRLPHLTEFLIGQLNSRLAANPAAIPVTRRYNINIIIGCQMSIAPSAVVYILQMPQLTELTFYECVFVDVDETIQLLQNSAAACGVELFHWYPVEWHQDLALAVTEKMPHLELFKARRCPKEQRDAFKMKCQFRD